MSESDLALARLLQDQFDQEANPEIASFLPVEYRSPQKKTSGKLSVVSDEWETIDPSPDLHALFIEFNQTFFWGQLLSCEVRWSPRMTTCAGICRYSPRERFCTIGISIPLLKLRPRKDLVETLLHEMIHAFLFVTDNNKDHDGHGPEFHKHMYRINKATGANISVYHTFHDEVALYKTHWWRCSGPCTKRPPFFGIVKRAMNRAPGPSDRWWKEHENSCGGTFNKIKEPEGFGKKKVKEKKENKKEPAKPGSRDIRSFIQNGKGGNSQNNNTKKGGTDINQGVMAGKGKGNSVNDKVNGSWKGGKGSPVKGGLDGSTSSNGKRKIHGIKSPSPVRAQNGGTNDSIRGKGGGRGNIFGFGGTSFTGPGSGSPGKGSSNPFNGSFIKPGSQPKTEPNNMPTILPTVMPSDPSSFGGRSLGGSVESTALSAREMARLKWASSSTTSLPGSSQIKIPKIDNRDKSSINIQKDNLNGLSHTSSININTSASFSNVQKSSCPVCNKLIEATKINEHLDICLTSPATSKSEDTSAPEKSIELDDSDMFNDSDDEMLSQALDDAETSMNSSGEAAHSIVKGNKSQETKKANGSDIISIIDSDEESDDEPLLIKSQFKSADDDQPLFQKKRLDDSLIQDDNDIMASLSDGHVYTSEEFACPVCDKLVASVAINSHLDACINNS